MKRFWISRMHWAVKGVMITFSLSGASCSSALNAFRSDPENIAASDSNQNGRWPHSEEGRQTSHFENANQIRENERVGMSRSFDANYGVRNRNPRATREDFIDRSQEEGSLWASSGQVNYYFTKNRVRAVGDIVSLTIENDLLKDIGAEIKRILSESERTSELAYVRKANELHEKASSVGANTTVTTGAIGTSRTPAAVKADGNVETKNSEPVLLKGVAHGEDFDIFSSIDVKLGDVIMGEIVERFPNGNYKIRGVKKIPYKLGGTKLVGVVGTVKATDISEESDSISSGKLYEYRVEVAR